MGTSLIRASVDWGLSDAGFEGLSGSADDFAFGVDHDKFGLEVGAGLMAEAVGFVGFGVELDGGGSGGAGAEALDRDGDGSGGDVEGIVIRAQDAGSAPVDFQGLDWLGAFDGGLEDPLGEDELAGGVAWRGVDAIGGGAGDEREAEEDEGEGLECHGEI